MSDVKCYAQAHLMWDRDEGSCSAANVSPVAAGQAVLVCATDGVWDMLSGQDTCSLSTPLFGGIVELCQIEPIQLRPFSIILLGSGVQVMGA
eukprot:2392040-Amphidinium_carterae.1